MDRDKLAHHNDEHQELTSATPNPEPRAQLSASAFEKSLDELKLIVQAMNEGKLNLEQSVTHFEKGIALITRCKEQLKAAEQRVKIPLESDEENHYDVVEPSYSNKVSE